MIELPDVLFLLCTPKGLMQPEQVLRGAFFSKIQPYFGGVHPVFHAFLTHFLAYMATKTGLREHSGMVNGPNFGPVEWEKKTVLRSLVTRVKRPRLALFVLIFNERKIAPVNFHPCWLHLSDGFHYMKMLFTHHKVPGTLWHTNSQFTTDHDVARNCRADG